jgi:SprT protein
MACGIVSWLRKQSDPGADRTAAPDQIGRLPKRARTQPHRVSVNNDLNKYAFLVTLVHEFAHYSTYVNTRRWTNRMALLGRGEYAKLMRPFMSRSVFPADVLHALEHHLHDAPASSCTDKA